MNATDKAHLERIKQHCIVCKLQGVDMIAEAHHIQSLKRAHWATIGLCYAHHRGFDSLHRRKNWFRSTFRHEWALWLLTRRLIPWPPSYDAKVEAYLKGKSPDPVLVALMKKTHEKGCKFSTEDL